MYKSELTIKCTLNNMIDIEVEEMCVLYCQEEEHCLDGSCKPQ